VFQIQGVDLNEKYILPHSNVLYSEPLFLEECPSSITAAY